MMGIQSINPTTADVIEAWEYMSPDYLDTYLTESVEAFQQWRITKPAKRRELLHKFADLLAEDIDQWAKMITDAMGKPLAAAKLELKKCVHSCHYFADHSEEHLQARVVDTEIKKSYVSYEPMGTILIISPWNYPVWQVIRFLAPNIMLGNTMILSHAPIVAALGFKLEQTMQQAGFPQGCFRNVIMDYEQAHHMIADSRIVGVTLTGSDRSGSIVAEQAGRCMKPVVLECGGSDPYVVLDDANLEWAAKVCVKMRLTNSGQVCVSAKRIIVEQAVFARFQQLVMAEIAHYTVGDPHDKSTQLGPLARGDLRQQVHEQVQKTIAEGAQCVVGGAMPEGAGFFYPITVLTNVTADMTAFKEEVFGPVIALIVARDEQHAIELANAHQYGLGGAVFTEDLVKGDRIARQEMNVGVCMVNRGVTSDVRLPFGGVKRSGFGRELGIEGLRSFANIKTIGVVESE